MKLRCPFSQAECPVLIPLVFVAVLYFPVERMTANAFR
jgi:hypothetical protein